MPPLPPSLVARLARKELREILRDRRTIITLVLMPVLLYPLLGMAFRFFLLSVAPADDSFHFRLVVRSQVELERLTRLLRAGRPDSDPEKEPDISYKFEDDLEGQLRADAADVAVELAGAARRFDPGDVRQGYEARIIYREDSPVGVKAAGFLRDRLANANVQLLGQRLRNLAGGREPVVPVVIEPKPLEAAAAGGRASYIAALIPLVLVLMTITGAVYPAIDLTAGERERGTLEILMAAPVPRLGLLLAKYAAVMAVAVLTGLVNLVMMTLTLAASGLGSQLFPEGLGIGTVLAVLGLLVLFAAFFSAVLLAITSFARSFKEAQAYLIPVMLLAISPGVVALMPGVKLGGLLTVAPLINVVLMARELLGGGVPLGVGTMVVLSTLLYAGVAVAVAARLFGAEAVLYSEQGQLAELFRRPRESRPAASLNAALLGLALAFPLAFLFNGLAAALKALPVEGQLLLQGALAALLFVGLPLASAYLSRVEPATGFGLFRPSVLGLAGALLLGLSLWPLILELTYLQERAGFYTMPDRVREALRDQVGLWRSARWAVLLALGVVTPLVEEVFFRGYLFGALARATRPRYAVVASALLFGLFHVFPAGILAVERFLPSALMGLVLGWVRWRSGSLWPGALLHVAHNCLLLSVALFPGLLGSEVTEGSAHVPTTWLAAAAAGAALGAVLVWAGRTASPRHYDELPPTTTGLPTPGH